MDPRRQRIVDILLIIAIFLFAWAAVVYAAWVTKGNAGVLTSLGLASVAAALLARHW